MFSPVFIEQNRNNAKAGIVSMMIILNDQCLVPPTEKKLPLPT
jgi:hypothetical protein